MVSHIDERDGASPEKVAQNGDENIRMSAHFLFLQFDDRIFPHNTLFDALPQGHGNNGNNAFSNILPENIPVQQSKGPSALLFGTGAGRGSG